MQAAAGLYERILEDVSGLSVGTIHSFCQTILNRFATEAGLDPHAVLMENMDDLVEEALDQLEREVASDPVLAEASYGAGKDPGSVRGAVRAAHKQRLRLDRWIRSLQPTSVGDSPVANSPRVDFLEPMVGQLRSLLLLGEGSDSSDPAAALFPRFKSALAVMIQEGLSHIEEQQAGGVPAAQAKSLKKTFDNLRGNLLREQQRWGKAEAQDYGDLVKDLKLIFLTASDQPRKLSTVRKDGLGAEFNALVFEKAIPLLDLFRRFGYLELLATNEGLLRLTLRLMDICDDLKRRDQVIDFQDLEDLASRLMSDPGRALSLLYRLDDSINHILVDEFQDTNFNQWEILEAMVVEFLSGGADPDRKKTVFFVGDVKQSIYGFRGAEPELFPQVTDLLRRFDQEDHTLPTNFRSLQAVVDSVGCVFTRPPLSEALPKNEQDSIQQHFARTDNPGKVVVLDPFDRPSDPEADDGRSGHQLAADAVARLASDLINRGTTTSEGFGDTQEERTLTWDDILVLCRTRTEISIYEKAFRDFGIPIISSGRGMLAASREAQDILALLRWLTYPEDDLALATVLRSPIFRWSEADFQAALTLRGVNNKREDGRYFPPRRLWQSIRKLDDDTRFGEAVTQLRKWRGHLGRETCHDLLRRIYREAHLLQRYQAALGGQARHNLLRIFDLALGPDVMATPTVRHLVEVIDRAARLGGEEEAVTPPGEGHGRVRFMTIHGAKGLEAPVVFLVDADHKLGKENPQLRLVSGSNRTPLIFKATKKYRQGFPGVGLSESCLEQAARMARAKDSTEDANLLYVAMTRARDRLYVVGGQKSTQEDHESFSRFLMCATAGGDCKLVERQGPDWLGATPAAFGNMPGDEDLDPGGEVEVSLQETRYWEPPTMTPRIKTTTPSTVEGTEAYEAASDENLPQRFRDENPPGKIDRQQSIRRGNLIHLILQQAADLGSLPGGQGAEHAEAAAVFANPDLAWIFHPAGEGGRGLSEVPVIHRETAASTATSENRVTGIIDRLILSPGRADIIDYKTNRTAGDEQKIVELVEHYRPQLDAYRQVVGSLYPDRQIGTWLLFTEPVPGQSPAGRLVEVC